MDLHALFAIARRFQGGTTPALADILPFVKDVLEAREVLAVLKGVAKYHVSVTTARLSAGGSFEPTGENLDVAVEAAIRDIERAGFTVLARDAGGGTGDGGDYHTVTQHIRFGMPPLDQRDGIIYEVSSTKDSTYGYPELCYLRQRGALPGGAVPLAFVVDGEITLSPFGSWNFTDEEIVRYVETGKYLPTNVYSRSYNSAGGIHCESVYRIDYDSVDGTYFYFDVDDPETKLLPSPEEPDVWLTRFGGRLTIGIDRRDPGLSGAGDPVWEDAPTRESAEPPAETRAAADLSRYEDEENDEAYLGTTLAKLSARLFGGDE